MLRFFVCTCANLKQQSDNNAQSIAMSDLKMPPEFSAQQKTELLDLMNKFINDKQAEVCSENQKRIIKALWQQCYVAAAGRWKGAGLASFIIAAPNKFEKHNALMAFRSVVGLAFPNIIVMYFNYEEQELMLHYLIDLVKEKLREIGIEIKDADNNTSRWAPILNMLHAKKMYLLIMIDNIEELYFSDKNKYPNARNIAMSINALGNLVEGQITTVVCGSSLKLPDLLYDGTSTGATFNYGFNHTKFPTIFMAKDERTKQCQNIKHMHG